MKTPTTDRYKYRRQPNAKYKQEEDVGYYALAAAIVKQAIDDYRYADKYLKGEHKLKSKSWATRYASNAEHTKDEVVKFFKSQWYGILCDIAYRIATAGLQGAKKVEEGSAAWTSETMKGM